MSARVVFEGVVERELHIGRGEGRSIVPPHAISEREPVCPAAVFDLPPLRELRHRVELGIEANEAVENLIGDGMRIPGRCNRRIQRSRVTALGDDKCCLCRRRTRR